MNETTNESTPALPAALPQNHSDMTFEPSPWLQRQLSGPVQWRAFGTAALAEARALDRPLLLVVASEDCLPFEQMAAESFADPATAAVLNEGYVCCLADARWHRELDRQLQLVHQLLVGRAGGWPLLALIDPADARPCFAGTYFPASPTPPLPGFADFLRQALGHFQRQRAPLQAQGERLAKAFAQLAPPPLPPGMALVSRPLELARQQLETRFDRETGAFTRGQPVPAAAAAQRLMRHWAQGAATPEPDLHALFMATLALTRSGASVSASSSDAAELAAFAAAAAATGEPEFRLAAEQVHAALAEQASTAVAGQASTAVAEQANTTVAELSMHTATSLPAVENWHRLRAMALAARWLDRPDWAETALAQHAAANWTTAGTLGDNAAALAATLALLELQWSASGFEYACELAASLCAQLGTAAPSPLPGLPPVPAQADDTLPSAEGVAALALYRLGCLCGSADWQAAAAAILRRAWRPMNEAATTHLTLLDTLEEQTLGLQTIVIRGTAAEAARWARALGRWYAPARQVFAIPADAAGLPPRLAALVPGDASEHGNANGKNSGNANQNATAWIFAGDATPVQSDSLEQLTRELRDRLHRG